MFRAHRPIFRRVHTAVHTTIGSVSVPFRSRAPYVVAGLGDCSLLEIRRYMNKIEIVTSVGFIPYAEKMHGTKSLKESQYLCLRRSALFVFGLVPLG